MKRGKRVSRRSSKKLFSRTASRTHKKNLHSHSMRGGIRM